MEEMELHRPSGGGRGRRNNHLRIGQRPWHLFLIANIVTTSKALVTTSEAPVTTSRFLVLFGIDAFHFRPGNARRDSNR